MRRRGIYTVLAPGGLLSLGGIVGGVTANPFRGNPPLQSRAVRARRGYSPLVKRPATALAPHVRFALRLLAPSLPPPPVPPSGVFGGRWSMEPVSGWAGAGHIAPAPAQENERARALPEWNAPPPPPLVPHVSHVCGECGRPHAQRVGVQRACLRHLTAEALRHGRGGTA